MEPAENSFQARKEKFKLIQDKLGSNPRSKENADRLLTYLQSGALPWRSNYSPEEEHDRDRLHTNYFLQIFFSVGNDILDNNLTESEVEDKLEDAREAEMPKNMPSDGSKGQWRTANKHRRKAYQWFLCEWDGQQFE